MSTTTQQQSSQQTSPWGPQATALTSAFTNAQNAYGQASGATAPTNYTAGFTPDQLATFQSMLGYSNNNTLPQSAASAATANTAAGTNATTGALNGFSGYDPAQALSAPSLISTAQQYMQGQNIPAEVQAAMLSANQNARDVTLPGIDQNAAITGNADSSRNGIAQGLVQRGLAEQAGALTGQLESQGWNSALEQASANANNSNAAVLQKLQDWGALGNTATNTGVNAGTSSINNQGTLYGIGENAGQGEQSANQANLTNQQQQYQAQVQDPFAALKEEMGIIGSNNWGSNSTGTSTSTSTPSALSVIGGLLGTAAGGASMLGGLGWKPLSGGFGGLFGGGGGSTSV